MSKNEKKPPIIINLLKHDNKFTVVDSNDFNANTSFSIPKNLLYADNSKNRKNFL